MVFIDFVGLTIRTTCMNECVRDSRDVMSYEIKRALRIIILVIRKYLISFSKSIIGMLIIVI